MAETQPTWISCQDPFCYTPQDFRLHDARLVCGEGVVISTGPELQVTQNVGDPLCVDIAQGGAWIDADLGGDCQGVYGVHNCGITTLCAADGDPTDPRIDRVVFQVNDSSLGGTQCDSELMIITGNPSPAPVAPAEPDNAITLALLTVTSAGITVISDERSRFVSCGGGRVPDMVLDQQAAASGTFEKADYPDASWFEVLIVGAGGGGAAVTSQGASNAAAAGAGAGGAGIRLRVPYADMPDSVNWNVGAGGVPGAAGGAANGTGANGLTGGSSSFGDWNAGAGQGGNGGVSTTAVDVTAIRIGGSVTFGTFGEVMERVAGNNSGYGVVLKVASPSQLISAPGADGPFGLGIGGTGRTTSGAGQTGSYMGRGGGGAASTVGGASFAGGAGGPGAIQVTVHY